MEDEQGMRGGELREKGHANYPPIADIVREGVAKASVSRPWARGLTHIASHHASPICSSVAPERSSVRKSFSSVENRQERIIPSLVRRVRSQAWQKGSDTEAMMPTRR